jgi:hypothetical protein
MTHSSLHSVDTTKKTSGTSQRDRGAGNGPEVGTGRPGNPPPEHELPEVETLSTLPIL